VTIISQWRFELTNWIKNGEQALLNFILPVLALAVAHYLPAENQTTVVNLAFVAANVASAFTGLAIVMAFDRRYGVLKLYAVSPLGLKGFFLAKVLVALTISTVQSIGIYLIASLIELPLPNALYVVVMLCVATPLWVSLAFIFASNLTAEAVLASANAVFVILAASSVPLLELGEISVLNPVSAGLSLLSGNMTPIVVLVTVAIVNIFFARRTFRWLD
jgi:ABC-2 type transport system permease protein